MDSEHSAILQCLQGENPDNVERLILTASGGPFLHLDKRKFSTITRAQALAHPTWKMGSKITIDSATLMNKGLEVIEAYWLFGLPAEKIDVVVHPQSIIHSMVEFVDGSIKAQLGVPDMKNPDPVCADVSGPLARFIREVDFAALRADDVFRAGSGEIPLPRACLSGTAHGRNGAGGAQCGQRSGGGIVSGRKISRSPPFRYHDRESALPTTNRCIIPRLEDIVRADKETRELRGSYAPRNEQFIFIH